MTKTDMSQCSADKEARVATLRLRRNDDAVVYISRIGCLRLCIRGGPLHHSWWDCRLAAGVCYVCVSVRSTTPTEFDAARTTTATFITAAVAATDIVVFTPVVDRVAPIHIFRRWSRWSMIRWSLLIDNVIYIIASTTESILAHLPLPWQASTALVGQF